MALWDSFESLNLTFVQLAHRFWPCHLLACARTFTVLAKQDIKKACTLENRFFFVFLHSVQWFFDLVFHIIDHFTTSISPNMVNDKEVRMVSTLAFTQNRWILSARRFLETLYDFSLSIDRSIDSFCSVIRPAAFYSHSLCTISSNNTQYIWLWCANERHSELLRLSL